METVTAYVERDEESGLYIGTVPGVMGAHTQAATLDELQCNLKEVLQLCIESGFVDPQHLPRFAGLQLVEVAV
ncbi:MAG: type II toxin-antitoxin system HicB family antitoxin [Tepidiformaceae bacterium]